MQVTNAINTEFTNSQPCLKIFCFHWKSGSSNLLVERIYSIVALRTFVLASVSNELLPKRRVLIKTGSQRSKRLLSVFSMVLRRVRLSVVYMGQWRRKCTFDSISKPQLQNGFKESWKPWESWFKSPVSLGNKLLKFNYFTLKVKGLDDKTLMVFLKFLPVI